MEENKKYYREAKVVLLETQKSNICTYCDDNILELYAEPINKSKYKPYHIYISTDEEIKEDDWVIEGIEQMAPLYISKIEKNDLKRCFENWENKSCRKIIASTDDSLIIKYDGKTSINKDWNGKLLPKITDEFIEYYIEQYNKANVIEDIVLVKLEKDTDIHSDDLPIISFTKLKVTPDDTINIKIVKESYSRDEVKQLLEKGMVYSSPFTSLSERMSDWIENNL